MTSEETRIARKSAFAYIAISTGAALAFLLATLLAGGAYTAVARIGGTVWVFVLTMIITMPLVIPAMKKKG